MSQLFQQHGDSDSTVCCCMWDLCWRRKCQNARRVIWNEIIRSFDTCQRVISHVSCSKDPPKQKKDFLTFMGECRLCVIPDKKDWLIRLGPRSIWITKKPPERKIEKKIPLPLDFKFRPLSLRMIPTFLPYGPLSDIEHQVSWRIMTEPEGPSPWLPSTKISANSLKSW